MSNSLAAMRPELVCEWSDKNLPLTPDKITYGSNKIVWWKAACGHEWQTSVKARSKGENCPICSGARVIAGINDLVTLKPELAQEWSDKNEIKPTEVSVASHKKVIWRCSLGHEWEASIKSRTVNGTGCPCCSHNKVLEGFNDLASQMPEIAAEWSEKNYPLLPTMVTPFANKKVWWKCSKGHEWHTLISTRSGGSKCPYCSGQILLKGFNDFATTQPQLAEEWSDRNLPLTPDMINEKSRKNVWWKCRECGNEWKSVVYARIKGTVCPVCADRAVLAGYNDLETTDAHNMALNISNHFVRLVQKDLALTLWKIYYDTNKNANTVSKFRNAINKLLQDSDREFKPVKKEKTNKSIENKLIMMRREFLAHADMKRDSSKIEICELKELLDLICSEFNRVCDVIDDNRIGNISENIEWQDMACRTELLALYDQK